MLNVYGLEIYNLLFVKGYKKCLANSFKLPKPKFPKGVEKLGKYCYNRVGCE